MKLDLTPTFLELGDATSHNFAFLHRHDVWVSYREEMITETNLLERNLSTTLRHWRLRFTEQSLLLWMWMWQVG